MTRKIEIEQAFFKIRKISCKKKRVVAHLIITSVFVTTKLSACDLHCDILPTWLRMEKMIYEGYGDHKGRTGHALCFLFSC